MYIRSQENHKKLNLPMSYVCEVLENIKQQVVNDIKDIDSRIMLLKA